MGSAGVIVTARRWKGRASRSRLDKLGGMVDIKWDWGLRYIRDVQSEARTRVFTALIPRTPYESA